MEGNRINKFGPRDVRDEDGPHAPPPTHPDDIPFDPEKQRKWEEARGITKKPSGPKTNDDGTVDFNIEFNYLDRKK